MTSVVMTSSTMTLRLHVIQRRVLVIVIIIIVSRPVIRPVDRLHPQRWRFQTITTATSTTALLRTFEQLWTTTWITCRSTAASKMLRERCSISIVDVVSVVDVRIVGADACSRSDRRPLIKPLVRLPLFLLQLLLTQLLLLLRFLFSQLFHSLSDCNQPMTPEL